MGGGGGGGCFFLSYFNFVYWIIYIYFNGFCEYLSHLLHCHWLCTIVLIVVQLLDSDGPKSKCHLLSGLFFRSHLVCTSLWSVWHGRQWVHELVANQRTSTQCFFTGPLKKWLQTFKTKMLRFKKILTLGKLQHAKKKNDIGHVLGSCKKQIR